jgi:hypothetical protein
MMPVPMVNILEFAHAVALLDRAASPAIVDRALRAAGINREVLRATSGFVPYAIEAAFLESVARALGERHLGAQAGIAFDYAAFGSYASYVLGARDLATAIAHGRRALPLIIPGADIVLRKRRSHVLIGFKSGLGSMIGSRHVEEGAAAVITKVPRHFLGADWRRSQPVVSTRQLTVSPFSAAQVLSVSRQPSSLPVPFSWQLPSSSPVRASPWPAPSRLRPWWRQTASPPFS